MKILVVDDDRELLELIAYALRQAGYLVLEAPDGPRALGTFRDEGADLVILDVNLPHLDGFEVLRRLRAESRVPVMMLTVRGAEEDQVRGLDLGADDYLTKPFSPRTLLARVRALLRRAGMEKPASLEAGDLVLDPDPQTVRVAGGGAVRLTGLEFRLLQLMVASAGRALPADRLVRHVWGYRGEGDRTQLKQLVHRLRRKIEPDPASPRYLVTAPGIGYLLRPGTD
jgi:DNA-binding response OmpR family regulator